MCRWSRRIIRRMPHCRTAGAGAPDVQHPTSQPPVYHQTSKGTTTVDGTTSSSHRHAQRDAKATLHLIGVTRLDSMLARRALSEQDLPQTCCPADWHWEHERVTERNEYTAAMGWTGRERRVGR
ncbi:hypothetical protein MTO96_010895 [Rhipicephalus appendiculatus]